jgi:transposase-like protein
MDLIKLMEQFGTEDQAREILERLRWPNGIECPRCATKSISRIYDRGQLDCNSCRYRFSVTTGTIFHDSHLSFQKWFLATFLMTESRKGVSANQLKRVLGVSYKTAWYLCHRIRATMVEVNAEMLSGTVEVDETYIGGKGHHGNIGRARAINKAIAVGAIQRGGKVRLRAIPNASRKELHAFIKETVGDQAAAIYTDGWPAYKGIADEDTKHETVNHRAKEWVNGDVHTNTVENIWSLLKRSIVGSYHKVSVKHLDAYLGELEFRFNNRKNQFLFRDTLKKLIQAEALPYKELIKAEASA